MAANSVPLTLPWSESFGRPTGFAYHWSFDTSSVPEGPFQTTRRTQSGADIQVFRATLDANANQHVIHIHVESTATFREVVWQVYHGGDVVARYNSLGQRFNDQLTSTSSGTFAMIPYQAGLTITIYWRIQEEL
ncbi:hypothetical protein BFJ63_vAg18947 [Fusarium oxysporum f. sp. narcissi]|uniref:Uncharacterized protein n=1 Tax=Fusarium oxysporum f. sp. narcissi TaxID=451672 RepID=A0A4Q2V0R5_FUSOX|nr:hypothetical protein BFJ63_vAg18947 [Fusarium oxysporum f. sp. narcissi]